MNMREDNEVNNIISEKKKLEAKLERLKKNMTDIQTSRKNALEQIESLKKL